MRTTAEVLIERGYQKYRPGGGEPESVIALYQKKFEDENGVKYFLSAREWDWEGIGREVDREALENYKFDYQVQFSAQVNGRPVNVEWFAGWEVEDVEVHAELLWQTGLYEYYEKN